MAHVASKASLRRFALDFRGLGDRVAQISRKVLKVANFFGGSLKRTIACWDLYCILGSPIYGNYQIQVLTKRKRWTTPYTLLAQ